MSWGSSLFTGVVTAIVGAIAAGVVAALAVSWYRIPSVEASSAAFLIGFVLLGIAAGFIIGIIVSRTFGATASASFLGTLGLSNAVVLGIAAVVGVSARLLADVPPTIDGEALMLAVEVRWPEGHATSPATLPGEPSLVLGSVTATRTRRASSRGPLWTSDAHIVDGRWVAPGAVDIFTTRGKLVLDVVLDSGTTHGFLIPLSGRPGRNDMQWTEWYPHARPGDPPLPNGFTYRYRVQKRSDVVRTETIGAFEVHTIADYFFDEVMSGDTTALATAGVFKVRHRGTPVSVDLPAMASTPDGRKLDTADGVATVARPGPDPALLVHFTDPETQSGACYVLTDGDGGRLETLHVPECTFANGSLLTSDSTEFRNVGRKVPRGRVNRVAFAVPGVYTVGGSIIDTRRLAVHRYSLPESFAIFPDVPPLGISPDGRSFVRFGSYYDGDNKTAVAVADFAGNRSYLLDVDKSRMRYATLDELDPAWLLHHFQWQKGADGADSLVARADFVPLPYRSRLAATDSYWYQPALEPLRDTVIEFLVKEFKGERIPVEAYAYEHPVKIDGQIINVAYGGSGSYVSVSLATGSTDRALLERVTHHIDTALATGKYDSLFGK